LGKALMVFLSRIYLLSGPAIGSHAADAGLEEKE
jgi:hypothetical protein